MRSLVVVPTGPPEPVTALGAQWCASMLPGTATVAGLEEMARHAARALARLRVGATVVSVPA